MSDIITVPVELGARSYDILTGAGLLARAGELTAPFIPAKRTVIVTDETVYGLHGTALSESLSQAGITHSFIIRPAELCLMDFSKLA